MWPFHRREPDPEDPKLRAAERHVEELVRRSTHVHRRLRDRHERNHWSETIDGLWVGRAQA